MTKIMYLDLETTGVDAAQNGTIQISGIIEIGGVVKEEINYWVAPFSQDVIEPKALEVNRMTEEDIMGFQNPSIIYMQLINTLQKYVDKFNRKDKFQLVGYNARFDDDFLRAWFRKNNDKYYGSFFSWPAIDITNLIALKLLNKRHELENFKLMTVARYLGIEVDESKAHDAMYDVIKTREMFMHLKEAM